METSLHRELKRLYADGAERTEVRLDGFRIDAVSGKELIEIQHGSLSSIRGKIARLLETRRVRVVKPIIAAKTLHKRAVADGPVIERRLSPKRGTLLDLFDELVYFTRVFPHRRLTLEVLLVEIEEYRHPGHGRRRRWRLNDHVVADQRLVAVRSTHSFRTARDLLSLLPEGLAGDFDTCQLALGLGIARHRAQRIAYCLRQTGAVREVGKRGNARLYRVPKRRRVG